LTCESVGATGQPACESYCANKCQWNSQQSSCEGTLDLDFARDRNGGGSSSSSSPTPSSGPVATQAPTVDSSGGGCVDSSSFTDKNGYSCSTWASESGTQCASYSGYTATEMAAIRAACPYSCDLCGGIVGSTDAPTNAPTLGGECPLGAKGCACTRGGFCDNGLKCDNSVCMSKPPMVLVSKACCQINGRASLVYMYIAAISTGLVYII
jgi:hypothetical protein